MGCLGHKSSPKRWPHRSTLARCLRLGYLSGDGRRSLAIRAQGHRVVLHVAGDLRAQTTTGQPFVASAPLNLIYAFDMSKLSGTNESEGTAAAAACVAMVGENVYLYCASAGLATVFRESVPGAKLAQTLKLPSQQIIQFAQTVGYPKT